MEGNDVDSIGVNGFASVSDDGTFSGVWVNQRWEEPRSNSSLDQTRGGHEEPDELRGSRPDLWGPGGAIPLGYSTLYKIVKNMNHYAPTYQDVTMNKITEISSLNGFIIKLGHKIGIV